MKRVILAVSVLVSVVGCTNSEEPKQPTEPVVAPETAAAPEGVQESQDVVVEHPQTSIDLETSSVVTPYNKSWEEYVLSGNEQSSPAQAMTPVTPPTQSVEVDPAFSSEETYLKIQGLLQPDIESGHIYEASATDIYQAQTYYVTSNGLNVRGGPSMNYVVVRQLPQGARVSALGREGIWVQIGALEYVSINFLSEYPTSVKRTLTFDNNK
ncbi:MAG: SH3 domain-containing protein [Oligoflexales bacterium]